MKTRKLLLQLFGIDAIGGSDFFKQAYEESLDNNSEQLYDDAKDVSETNSDETVVENVEDNAVEETDPIVEDEPIVDDQHTDVPSVDVPGMSKADIEAMFKEFVAKQEPKQLEPQLTDEQKQAIELYNYLKDKPDVVNVMKQADEQTQEVASGAFPTVMEKRLAELEQKSVERDEKEAQEFYNLQVEKLKTTYADYDEDKVLDYAYEHGLTGEDNLENAYLILKARGELGQVEKQNTVDQDALKAQIEAEVRAKIESEIKANKQSTGTTVSSVDGGPQERIINLTPEQAKYAKVFGMTEEEYYDELTKN